ncbi:N-(5'-phosphoribosyl)anthranilate isomerase [Halobacteriales archaeon QS_1_68_20]|nr:MAG: N-(5'-phosphoribosyl)anthranilate isomerase [Halobacteriales archaeon QS_1_68_20]
MTRVKVCGITREADLRATVAAGADAVGVVADVPVDTPREVGVDRAADLLAAVPPFVTGVLVTMPGTAERALELVDAVEPDAIQVHGDLPPEALATVADEASVRVLRAVDAEDLDAGRQADDATGEVADVADALVVDSTTSEGAGGTGRTHDWARTREATADLDAPVVLAGGLTPGNVAEAVDKADPFAVDVASGVEREGGVKDNAAVEQFVERTRRPLATP